MYISQIAIRIESPEFPTSGERSWWEKVLTKKLNEAIDDDWSTDVHHINPPSSNSSIDVLRELCDIRGDRIALLEERLRLAGHS